MGVRSVNNATLNTTANKNSAYSWENKLNLNKALGRHNFNAVFVHHLRYGSYYINGASAVGFPYEQLNVINQSDPNGRSASGSKMDIAWSQLSYLGRIIYDYNSKYLITASYRRDGTSNFGPGNRWGNFPSFSAAWKVNEDFLRNVDEISMLKLRFGWGMTGNSNIGSFRYQSRLTNPDNFKTVFGDDQHGETAMNEWLAMGNPIIKWEAANMTNIGLDLNLFKNKLQLSAEYYVKNQNDLLLEVPVSGINGKYDDWNFEGTGVWYNIGEIHNKGFEFDLRYSDYEGPFNYTVFGNLSTVKNQVDYIPKPFIINDNITAIGHTIGSLYGYVAERIIQESDFDEEGNYLYAMPVEGKPEPGDIMFKDLNKDGTISDMDRTIIGKGLPNMSFSFGMNSNFRNFDMSLYFYGVQNVEVYNTIRRDTESFRSQDLDHNKSAEWAFNHYSAENPSTEFIRLDQSNSNNNSRTSTWWVEDASFLRLKEAQIGYTIPENILQSIRISSFRVYLSGVNLFTLTKYKGYDPEAPLNSADPRTTAVDYNTYPVARTITAGLQISF
jgi:TonB-linked SusC/RagA family outer membrane protein